MGCAPKSSPRRKQSEKGGVRCVLAGVKIIGKPIETAHTRLPQPPVGASDRVAAATAPGLSTVCHLRRLLSCCCPLPPSRPNAPPW